MNFAGSAAYKADEVGRPMVKLSVKKLLKASEVGILVFLHCNLYLHHSPIATNGLLGQSTVHRICKCGLYSNIPLSSLASTASDLCTFCLDLEPEN